MMSNARMSSLASDSKIQPNASLQKHYPKMSSVASHSKSVSNTSSSLRQDIAKMSAQNSTAPFNNNAKQDFQMTSNSRLPSNTSLQNQNLPPGDENPELEPEPPKEHKCGPPPEEGGLKPLIKEISREVLQKAFLKCR
jgi:hypothetical protein